MAGAVEGGHTGAMSELLADGAPFDFLTIQPEPPLARYVESLWFARGTVPYAREKIAPTGSTVAVFILGPAILQTPRNGEGEMLRAERGFLIGPHDRPTVNEPTGETFAVGIVTTPIGCETLFGLAPSTLRGEVVDLEEAWTPAVKIRDALQVLAERAEQESFDGATVQEAMLSLVEAELLACYNPSLSGIDRCERAVEMLEAEPTRPIGDIADELGLTHGHLDREFTRVVGLSPRALARLLRMRRLLLQVDIKSEVPWSNHAAELGWFDQAHLIRDFKRHTGVTPSHYLEAQRAMYTTVEAGDAAGFVPEP